VSDDLRRRLAEIGLEQLTEIFAANDIDLDILPDLSDEDLKELGLSLGHRRAIVARDCRAIEGTIAADR